MFEQRRPFQSSGGALANPLPKSKPFLVSPPKLDRWVWPWDRHTTGVCWASVSRYRMFCICNIYIYISPNGGYNLLGRKIHGGMGNSWILDEIVVLGTILGYGLVSWRFVFQIPYRLINQHSNRISTFFNRKYIFKGSICPFSIAMLAYRSFFFLFEFFVPRKHWLRPSLWEDDAQLLRWTSQGWSTLAWTEHPWEAWLRTTDCFGGFGWRDDIENFICFNDLAA